MESRRGKSTGNNNLAQSNSQDIARQNIAILTALDSLLTPDGLLERMEKCDQVTAQQIINASASRASGYNPGVIQFMVTITDYRISCLNVPELLWLVQICHSIGYALKMNEPQFAQDVGECFLLLAARFVNIRPEAFEPSSASTSRPEKATM